MSDLFPEADGSSERRTSFPAAPPMVIDPAKTYTAEMVTSMGSMTIHLDPIAAPQTVNSFVYLARWHYFDGLIFHRVINGFVIQGGCPDGTGRGGPGYTIPDEFAPGLAHTQKGMFSMLPLSADQIARAREEHAVYIAPGGRINICGLPQDRLDEFASAIAAVSG